MDSMQLLYIAILKCCMPPLHDSLRAGKSHILLVGFFLLPSPRKRSAPNAGGLVRGALGSAMEPICPDSGHTKDNKTNESSATGDRPIGPSMAVLQQLSSHLLDSGVYVGYYRCLG